MPLLTGQQTCWWEALTLGKNWPLLSLQNLSSNTWCFFWFVGKQLQLSLNLAKFELQTNLIHTYNSSPRRQKLNPPQFHSNHLQSFNFGFPVTSKHLSKIGSFCWTPQPNIYVKYFHKCPSKPWTPLPVYHANHWLVWWPDQPPLLPKVAGDGNKHTGGHPKVSFKDMQISDHVYWKIEVSNLTCLKNSDEFIMIQLNSLQGMISFVELNLGKLRHTKVLIDAWTFSCLAMVPF